MRNRVSRAPSASTGYMTNEILDDNILESLVKHLSQNRPAAIRLVEFLAKNPESPSVHVNRECAIGNISQEATAANKKLFKQGYMVGCMRPPSPLKNRFKQDTAQHLWSIYKLPKEAANDSVY
jgi:hypothetical protein